MTDTIARLHIALADTDPLIWRRVELPVDASLKMLHDVIQGAMGWLDYHLWEFEAGDRRHGLPDSDWKGFDPEETDELIARLRTGDIAKRRAAGRETLARRRSS